MTTDKTAVVTPAKPIQAVVNASCLSRCEECGKEFQPYRTWSRFCSEDCKWENFKASHVRCHKADLAAVIGKDWQQKLAEAKQRRTGK